MLSERTWRLSGGFATDVEDRQLDGSYLWQRWRFAVVACGGFSLFGDERLRFYGEMVRFYGASQVIGLTNRPLNLNH